MESLNFKMFYYHHFSSNYRDHLLRLQKQSEDSKPQVPTDPSEKVSRNIISEF